MLKRVKEIYLNVCSNGLPVPFIFDKATNKPSITLMFAYLAFILASVSIVALHFYSNLFTATSMALIFWATATILYMFRSLHKAKIDLDDKSLELEGEEEKNET